VGRLALNFVFWGPAETYDGVFGRPISEKAESIIMSLVPPQRSM